MSTIAADSLAKKLTRNFSNVASGSVQGDILGRVTTTTAEFETYIAQAERSGEYHPIGIRRIKNERARLAFKEFADAEAALSRSIERIAELRAESTALPTREGDPTVLYLRDREIRDRLLSLKDHDIQIKNLLYADAGPDPDVLHAIATAPKSFPVLPAADFQKFVRRGWAKQNPDKARELESLEREVSGGMTVVNAARAGVLSTIDDSDAIVSDLRSELSDRRAAANQYVALTDPTF